MSVLPDYKCPVHGYFESRQAVCPSGCTDVQLVFLQPVGIVIMFRCITGNSDRLQEY